MHWYTDVLRRYMDLRWPPGTARLPRRADVREDASVRLAVDVDRLLFFNWKSGRAIR